MEGTFRVSGSNKRMRELQALFDTPPRVSYRLLDVVHGGPTYTCFTAQYGKDLEWNKRQFTTHDVASVFRRYLTQMPVRGYDPGGCPTPVESPSFHRNQSYRTTATTTSETSWLEHLRSPKLMPSNSTSGLYKLYPRRISISSYTCWISSPCSQGSRIRI